jgi:hypothetical protein
MINNKSVQHELIAALQNPEVEKDLQAARDAAGAALHVGQNPTDKTGSDARVLSVRTLTHEVTFIVASNISVTPTWSLMRFKGPSGVGGGGASPGNSGSTGSVSSSGSANGGGGSLASAFRYDSHDLIITLGDQPDVDTENAISQAGAVIMQRTGVPRRGG